jgi:hypothetical protein
MMMLRTKIITLVARRNAAAIRPTAPSKTIFPVEATDEVLTTQYEFFWVVFCIFQLKFEKCQFYGHIKNNN